MLYRPFSLLAWHYLACTLTLDFKGRELASLIGIWEYAFDIFVDRRDRPLYISAEVVDVEQILGGSTWCNALDMCIENFLSSGKSIRQFLPLYQLDRSDELLVVRIVRDKHFVTCIEAYHSSSQFRLLGSRAG